MAILQILQIHLDSEFWGNPLRAYLIAAGIILLSIVIAHLLKRFLIVRLSAWAEKSSTTADDFLIRGVNRTLLPMLYVAGIYFGIANLQFAPYLEKAIDIITKIVITFFAVRIIVATVSYLLSSYIRKQERGEEKLRQSTGIMVIISCIIWAFGLVFLLANLGYDVTAIVAGLGIGGIAVALAAQTILGDLFSYFVIFFDRPFEVGDFIIIDDKMGTVQYIGIKTTRLNSLSGEQLVFSNTDLTNSRLHNYKRMQKRRVVFQVRIIYETSPEKVELVPKLIREIIEKQEDILFDRAHFASFGDYSLNFEACYYVLSDQYNKYMDTQQAINLELFREFAKQDIQFAYPTQLLLQPDLKYKADKIAESLGNAAPKGRDTGNPGNEANGPDSPKL